VFFPFGEIPIGTRMFFIVEEVINNSNTKVIVKH